MAEYIAVKDGKRIEVYEFDKCIDALVERHKDNEKRIQSLTEENKLLKEKVYKDKELQKMQARLEKLEREMRLGFRISEAEDKEIAKWMEEHEIKKHRLKTPYLRMKAQGVSGGRYTYHFLPTAIGTLGTVKCVCGAEFEFRELG